MQFAGSGFGMFGGPLATLLVFAEADDCDVGFLRGVEGKYKEHECCSGGEEARHYCRDVMSSEEDKA